MVKAEPEQWSEILANHSDAVAALARSLRAAALEALPDLTERVYPGWSGLGLRHPRAGLVASIFGRDEDVAVYIERGAFLPDPDGLFEGAGRLKRTRMIIFHPERASPSSEQLVAYLDLAVDHASSS